MKTSSTYRLFLIALIVCICFVSVHAQNSIYVRSDGSNSNSGLTPSTAVRTIQQGIQKASSAGIHYVRIIAGTYTESIDVVGGIHVIGGHTADGTYSPATAHVQVLAALSSTISRPVCLTAISIFSTTYITDIEFAGPTVTTGDSYAVYVRFSSGIVFQNVTIEGQSGGDGIDGVNGTSPSLIRAEAGSNGGQGAVMEGCDDSTRGQGGSGGTEPSAGVQRNGGRGGNGGTMDTDCNDIFFGLDATNGMAGANADFFNVGNNGHGGQGGPDCNNGLEGWPGVPGQDGPGGSHGIVSLPGALSSSNFWADQGNGNNGGFGTDGGGGGGGGGSGGCDAGTDSYGAGGGGGGAGGSRATSVGTGGKRGGNSFAVFAVNSSIKMLSCHITGGHGGDGGIGGTGGLGQSGGMGGLGGTNPKGDFGGNGGEGGKGGNAGAGGSGAGGYSFGVYLSTSSLVSDNSQFQTGVPGLGGQGGNNGQARDVYPSYTTGTVDPLRQEQTLTIPNITSIDDCSVPIDFNVQASSGLEVEITTTSPIATINGHQITFSGNGTVVLNIVQPGNDVFAPVSTTVSLSVQCSGQSQTITFLPIGPKHITDPPFQIQASASSGLAVILELVNGPAELNGNLLTILGIGEVTIKATQPGNNVFAPAQEVIESFIVTKVDQVINFAPIGDHSLGGPALALQATSTSGLPVNYFLSGPGVLTNNSLSLIGTGTISIIAIQNGNSNYNPAPAISQTFNVNSQNGSLIPVWFADSDADGFGNGNTTLASCIPLPGFVQNTDDCDDTNAAIKPGSTEVKDGKDNNCNGQIDEGFLTPTILDLSITAVCADLPLISRRWKINNPNSKAVAVEWEIVGTIQKSWFEVPPGDSYLTALFIVGSSNTARIFWHNDIGQRKSLEKASITTKCSKSSTSARESMSDPAETNDQGSGKILNIYPNPGSTIITIEIYSEVEAKEPLELITMGGIVKDEKVVQLGAGTNFITHDVSNLSTGVYLIKTKNQSIRFVKE